MTSDTKTLNQNIADLKAEIKDLEEILHKKKKNYELRNELQQVYKYSIRPNKLHPDIYTPKPTCNRNGKYHKMELQPEYENKWKGSFFEKHRLCAESLTTTTLSSQEIRASKEWHARGPFFRSHTDDPFYFDNYLFSHILLYVDAVLPHPEGPVLKLSDPFGSITSQPSKKLSFEEAGKLVGRLVYCNLGIHSKFDLTPVKDLQLLKYPLYD